MIDDEIGPAGQSEAAVLCAVLYEAAIDAYRRLFPVASPFWGELDLRMTQWRSATADKASERAGAAHRPRLSSRGAPLKLCAFAVCDLAGRMDLFPVIESCLDEALTAMVLYDHVCDWQTDLDAGRWNAFVAASAGQPPRLQDRDRTRANVYVGMMAGSAVGRYFGRIHRSFARAVDATDGLSMPELTDYLRKKMADIDSQGKHLERRYSELGNQAAAVMLAGLRAG